MKIAVLGLGPSAEGFNHEPWDRVYALPWDNENRAKATHLFEMHPLGLACSPDSGRPENYLDELRELVGRPLFMQKEYELVPNAEAYPLAEIRQMLGLDYFGSSPAYMLAHAIWVLGPGEPPGQDIIGLWGVDLTESIYDHQRPNLEYLCGHAHARGIQTAIAAGGRLLQHHPDDTIGALKVRYPARYGWDPEVLW